MNHSAQIALIIAFFLIAAAINGYRRTRREVHDDIVLRKRPCHVAELSGNTIRVEGETLEKAVLSDNINHKFGMRNLLEMSDYWLVRTRKAMGPFNKDGLTKVYIVAVNTLTVELRFDNVQGTAWYKKDEIEWIERIPTI